MQRCHQQRWQFPCNRGKAKQALIHFCRTTKSIIGLIQRRANARNINFRISLQWRIHIINPVDETKLSCYTSHWRSTTVSLQTHPPQHDICKLICTNNTNEDRGFLNCFSLKWYYHQKIHFLFSSDFESVFA